MNYDESTKEQAKFRHSSGDFTAGRDLAKESLSIALRALERLTAQLESHQCGRDSRLENLLRTPEYREALEAIAQIKERGDYIPMEGK